MSALEAVRRIASRPSLLVALDFDGTLAPTVDDPAKSRALPGAMGAIETLASAEGTVVAIVSGRHLAGLREVVEVPSHVVLVGSHGAEALIDGEEIGPTLTEQENQLLHAVWAAAESVAARYSGVRLERKPAGCALHTRLASASDTEAARNETLAAVQALNGSSRVTQRDGKDILEFLVRSADKGSALQWLRERYNVTNVVFIGDDVTDEDGFRRLVAGDVGIKVGAGDTAAQYRVADPNEAVHVLSVLAKTRSERPLDTATSRTP